MFFENKLSAIEVLYDPFANFNPFLFEQMFTLHLFCNLVLRTYAGLLGCARDECLFC